LWFQTYPLTNAKQSNKEIALMTNADKECREEMMKLLEVRILTYTTASMGRGSVLKRVYVRLDGL
jgi:ribosomal protein L30E